MGEKLDYRVLFFPKSGASICSSCYIMYLKCKKNSNSNFEKYCFIESAGKPLHVSLKNFV